MVQSSFDDESLLVRVLSLYMAGQFPMADGPDGEIHVCEPTERGILPLEGLRASRSLRQRVRSSGFTVTTNNAFRDVLAACADRQRAGSWISPELCEIYTGLHELGHAHSVEVWVDERLVGGLFGVAIAGLFAGESMFCRPDQGGTDASKVALCHLVGVLRDNGFALLDTQFQTPHLETLGVVTISQAAYKQRLAMALLAPGKWPCPGELSIESAEAAILIGRQARDPSEPSRWPLESSRCDLDRG